MPGRGPGRELLLVIDQPGYLDGVLLPGRTGRYLEKLLERSGWADRWYLTCLVHCDGKFEERHLRACKPWTWLDMKTLTPRVVVPLGKLPTRVLLRLSDGVKLSEWIGKTCQVDYLDAPVVPWYDPVWLVQQGNDLMERTTEFLRGLHEVARDNPGLVPARQETGCGRRGPAGPHPDGGHAAVPPA